MKDIERRLTNLEMVTRDIRNHINNIDPTWASLREKWTVITGVLVLLVFFLIIIVAAIYGQFTVMDKLSATFNAFIMAMLGYLFGYVPTKSSEEAIKEDKKITENKLGKIEMALDEYKAILTSKDKIIKDYEEMINLYKI